MPLKNISPGAYFQNFTVFPESLGRVAFKQRLGVLGCIFVSFEGT